MAKPEGQPIIKRVKKAGHGGAHGGVWKLAYADFVTAMMAFFLLMWLLGSTTKGDLLGIAEFFQTPLKVALAGGSGSGDSSSVLKGGGTDLTVRVGDRQVDASLPLPGLYNVYNLLAGLAAVYALGLKLGRRSCEVMLMDLAGKVGRVLLPGVGVDLFHNDVAGRMDDAVFVGGSGMHRRSAIDAPDRPA